MNENLKNELLNKIGDLLVEEILSSVGDSKSPIKNERFDPLSKKYAAIKLEEVGNKKPNLDLSGDMLSALDFAVSDGKIEIGIFGEEAPKADGHNDFSGRSLIPKRRFLPGEDQTFVKPIQSLVDETIAAFIADNVKLDEKRLKDIDTKKDLYDYLKEILGDYSRAELKSMVLESELAVELDGADLLDSL